MVHLLVRARAHTHATKLEETVSAFTIGYSSSAELRKLSMNGQLLNKS